MNTTVKALTFDVFGTVVDWYSAITRDGNRIGMAKSVTEDWSKFAEAWRGGYQPAMDRVRRGELPWTNFDRLQRLTLDATLESFGLSDWSEAEKEDFTNVWTRIDAWPDVKAGLEQLRQKHIVATLSNGNMGMLTRLSKYAGIHWDCILSAELSHHYKPDPEMYLKGIELLNLTPGEVMMVASHKYDLKAAKAVGMQTALVKRPLEYGPNGKPDFSSEAYIDVVVEDFEELAGKLKV